MSHQDSVQNELRIEFPVHFQAGYRGRKHLRKGTSQYEPDHRTENLPRLTRLLALAHSWDRLIEDGTVSDYAEIARMMELSRARVTQIMDLLYLARDIQEEILLFPRREQYELNVPVRAMRSITRIACWNDQRKLWRNLRGPLIRREEQVDVC